MTLLALLAVAALALANGSNDNFKGVATLYGSGVASYRGALAWATVTTLAGSLAASVLAGSLAQTFSGGGLVSPAVARSPDFLAAVGCGAAVTVLVASRAGLPVSTTHALAGALLGAGLSAAPGAVAVGALAAKVALPLVASPLVALVLARGLHALLGTLIRRLGIVRGTCLCVGGRFVPVARAEAGGAITAGDVRLEPHVWSGDAPACTERYQGAVLGVDAARLVGRLHFVSAGAMSFARGLNDTPKIAAVALAAGSVSELSGSVTVGIAIGVGGILGARRVAETVAHRIVPLEPGQGLAANLVTAVLVTLATPLGLPVSTTHVSTGSIVGVGVAAGTSGVRWKTLATIGAAWLTTLPLAALLAALCHAVLARV
ncbi:MAG: inorganic phosphate transporter [Myxococcales bacterium]|nr:inorganic phosphate transporter [Myxococcales bacterium]